MGFFDWLGPGPKKRRKPRRYTARRVSLSRGGYDRHGRYWGVGEPLYCVEDSEGDREKYVRAESAKSAIAKATHERFAGWRRR